MRIREAHRGRVLVALLFVLGPLGKSIAAPAPAFVLPNLDTLQAEQTDPEKIIVYVTSLTGGKYHREGCRYLSKSKISISLKDAAPRYQPCKTCKPPRLPK